MTGLPEYCVWDFNGTILDDVGVGIESVNTLLSARGLPTIESKEAYQRVFRFPIRSYYEHIGFDFEKEPYEVIAPLWVAEYMKRVGNAGMCEGVYEVLCGLRALGVKQIILSATEKGMLEGQLESLGIRDFFEEVLGLDNIHAASKLQLARDWRAQHPKARAIFLGDTDHDYETAREMGAECFLIAGGHQSEEYLRTVGKTVYRSVTEFYKEFEKMTK